MSNWLHLSTAPGGCRTVLLRVKLSDNAAGGLPLYDVVRGARFNGVWREKPRFGGVIGCAVEATHWMPLPDTVVDGEAP